MENKNILSTGKNSEVQKKKEKSIITRRSFLKKAAYSAPVLMIMGQLARPTLSHAYGSGGPPPPPPPW